MKTEQMNEFIFVETNSLASKKIDTPKYSYWRSVICKFFSNKVVIFILILMLAVLLIGFTQPLFSGYKSMDVKDINDSTKRYNPPSAKSWFRTDVNDMPLFGAVWAGAKTSISISVIATLIITVIGVVVGAIRGTSKAIDRFMLEIYNIISNVPTLLIVIVFSYTFGSGSWNLILAVCVANWLSIAYFIRVQVVIICDREYNLASKTLGASTLRIISRDILPYPISIAVTDISRALPSFISYKTFLSFLGVGLGSDVPSLGRLIAEYANNMNNYPYLFWIPVTILTLVPVSLCIVGQTLVDAADPRTHT